MADHIDRLIHAISGVGSKTCVRSATFEPENSAVGVAEQPVHAKFAVPPTPWRDFSPFEPHFSRIVDLSC